MGCIASRVFRSSAIKPSARCIVRGSNADFANRWQCRIFRSNALHLSHMRLAAGSGGSVHHSQSPIKAESGTLMGHQPSAQCSVPEIKSVEVGVLSSPIRPTNRAGFLLAAGLSRRKVDGKWNRIRVCHTKCSISFLEKSKARPASPRSRPTSPVNGAGGITGCRNDSEAPGVVPGSKTFFGHG
jgi:hypothetical protein